MSWNYRVVQESQQYRGRRHTSYSIREIYYDKKGEPDGYTKGPITIGGFDNKVELLTALAVMLKDAITRPILKLSHKKERLYPRGKK